MRSVNSCLEDSAVGWPQVSRVAVESCHSMLWTTAWDVDVAVVRSSSIVVRTSARLAGRCTDGFADSLRELVGEYRVAPSGAQGHVVVTDAATPTGLGVEAAG